VVTDSETFYNSILNLLEDPEEAAEVEDLLNWWNRSVPAPLYVRRQCIWDRHRKVLPLNYRETTPVADSAIARIKERRRRLASEEPGFQSD
jgi:hypothetical protein